MTYDAAVSLRHRSWHVVHGIGHGIVHGGCSSVRASGVKVEATAAPSSMAAMGYQDLIHTSAGVRT